MILIRPARIEDCGAVASMVCALAAQAGVAAGTTAESLHREAFGDRPTIAILVAEDSTSGAIAGYTIHQDTFSTYRGSNGLFIVDLFVVPERRNDGVGALLLAEAARQGWRRGATFIRLDLDQDNDAAKRFYGRLGFKERGDRFYVLDEPDFSQLAAPLG